MNITRRSIVLWGAGGALLAFAAAILGKRAYDGGQRIAAAEADYLAGRVMLDRGWIMSVSEGQSDQTQAR